MGSVAFCINKSGSAYNIYDSDQNNAYVGKINPRESYIARACEWGTMVYFLNSSGNFVSAYVDTDTYPLPSQDVYVLPETQCTMYPYGTVDIDGKEYYTFKMRSRKNVYTAAANKWGAVAAGCLVATTNSDVGDNHVDWKEINYVQSSSGAWVKVTGDGYSHGFVDTGISSASGYSKIPFYGSW